MKKYTFPIVIACMIFFFFIIAAIGGDGCSSIKIENYQANINITANGDMEITERYTYNYQDGYSAKYRDIEINKYNSQNPIFQSRTDTASLLLSNDITENVRVYVDGELLPGYDISSTNRYVDGNCYIGTNGDRDERGEIISCDPSSSTCHSLFVYCPGGFGSETIFEYNYTIKGALTLYNDIASINWKIFEYNESDVNNGTVTITIPENSYSDELRCWARGAKSKGTIDIVSNRQVVIKFDCIEEDRALEFRLLSNHDIYTGVDSKNIVNASVLVDILEYEDAQAKLDNTRILVANILFYGSFVLIIVMGLLTYYVYKKFDKEYPSNFDAEYLRELPDETLTPAEVGYLYFFGTVNDEDVTATLLDLIRKKYLVLETAGESVNEKNPNFIIKKVEGKDYSQLKPHEKFLINWFIQTIGDGNQVTIKQIEKYPTTEVRAKKFENDCKQFMNLCKKEGEKHNFIEKASAKAEVFAYAFIPLIYLLICISLSSSLNVDVTFAVVVSLILFLAFLIYSGTIKRRTKAGNEQFVRWKAFRHFLEDFSSMEDYPIPGIIIWEHFLVYATSLKIADKVMEQLEVKLPKITEEVEQATYMRYNYGPSGFYRGYVFGRISSSVHSARMVGMQTIAQANASKVSSGGHGGGFSGGSSFGGGGGGGRSR